MIVGSVKYRGEDLPVNVSFFVIRQFKEETGKDMSEVIKDPFLLEPLLYYALVSGAKKEGNKRKFLWFEWTQFKFKYKRSEVDFILDECLDQFVKIINKVQPEASKKK